MSQYREFAVNLASFPEVGYAMPSVQFFSKIFTVNDIRICLLKIQVSTLSRAVLFTRFITRVSGYSSSSLTSTTTIQ